MKYILYVLYLSITSGVLFSQELFLIFSHNVNFELYQWFRGKESAYNAGDAGLIPRLGRSPVVENGNPLQCFCLENSVDGGDWQATVHGVTKELDTTE